MELHVTWCYVSVWVTIIYVIWFNTHISPVPSTSFHCTAPLPCEEPLGQDQNVGLRSCLERRGLLTSVVPVKRSDWLRVFLGILLDDDARAGNGTARGAYGWYLDLTKTAIEESLASTGQPAILIGHSAGGWLGRAVLEREGLDT